MAHPEMRVSEEPGIDEGPDTMVETYEVHSVRHATVGGIIVDTPGHGEVNRSEASVRSVQDGDQNVDVLQAGHGFSEKRGGKERNKRTASVLSTNLYPTARSRAVNPPGVGSELSARFCLKKGWTAEEKDKQRRST